MNVKIYHNPRCSKSRQALALLQDQGITPDIIEYLKHPPSLSELHEILHLLKLEPRDVMRKQEAEYKILGLDDMQLSREVLCNALLNYPKLLERPIVLANHKAAIGRPPETRFGYFIT
ncbi:MAG: arsenate reductase (glutaredoxin) [Methylococcales bacterium]|nr:arsenate reductase (glutaredoxin) [Methylococcales bacterium]